MCFVTIVNRGLVVNYVPCPGTRHYFFHQALKFKGKLCDEFYQLFSNEVVVLSIILFKRFSMGSFGSSLSFA